MLSDITNAGPAVIIHYDGTQQSVTIHAPSAEQARWSKGELEKHCEIIFRTAISHHQSHPDRLVYGIAGKVFHKDASRPIGGKKRPGYVEFSGETAGSLLRWIIKKATNPPDSGRGRRRAAPGETLRFVVGHFNEILRLQRNRCKDELDELVLRGLSKAGHLAT
ncbi:hypothetical protein HDU67_003484, partial [Dinochytrium kinnereticum]